jgi:fluoroquinolone resistance protein
MSDNYFENIQFNELDILGNIASGAEFVECHFTAINFESFNLSRLKFIDCEFTKCSFNNVSVKSTIFRSPKFNHSKMMGINWTEAGTFSSPMFNECLIDYSVFQKLNLKNGSFLNCKMAEVDFYEAQCVKVSFQGSMLYGTTFNGANLSEADFRGATEYSIRVLETNISKAKFSMPEAISLLDSLNITIGH